MTIEIKKSVKPIKYKSAIDILEDRLEQIKVNKNKELIWILEHEEIYTGGTSFSDNEILDKSINFIKTNRGGKITYHGPGQLVFYFVIDLNKRGKNIKKIITAIEKTIINTLKNYDEVILLGSGKGVVSVKSIDQIHWRRKSKEIYNKFLKLYLSAINKCKKYN